MATESCGINQNIRTHILTPPPPVTVQAVPLAYSQGLSNCLQHHLPPTPAATDVPGRPSVPTCVRCVQCVKGSVHLLSEFALPGCLPVYISACLPLSLPLVLTPHPSPNKPFTPDLLHGIIS